MAKNKPQTGYEERKPKNKKQKSKKEKQWLASLIISPEKATFKDRVIKFAIYIGLRAAIKPSKWKNPEKNIEVIDRTYKRLKSIDFIFIPSSIAFFMVMSLMPVLSIISFLYSMPFLHELLGDSVINVLGRFIPGIDEVLMSIRNLVISGSGISAGALTALIVTFIITTWISAGGTSQLIYTQSYVYGYKFKGGYFLNRLRGMAIVIIFTLFLMTALSISVGVDRLILMAQMSSWLETTLIYLFSTIMLLVSTFTLFALLYRFSPRFKIKMRHVLPGTMVTTIPTFLFLALFGSISSLWSYGSYGTVGVIMYVGISSMIITTFVVVGLIANAAYYKTFVRPRVEEKKTLARK